MVEGVDDGVVLCVEVTVVVWVDVCVEVTVVVCEDVRDDVPLVEGDVVSDDVCDDVRVLVIEDVAVVVPVEVADEVSVEVGVVLVVGVVDCDVVAVEVAVAVWLDVAEVVCEDVALDVTLVVGVVRKQFLNSPSPLRYDAMASFSTAETASQLSDAITFRTWSSNSASTSPRDHSLINVWSNAIPRPPSTSVSAPSRFSGHVSTGTSSCSLECAFAHSSSIAFTNSR